MDVGDDVSDVVAVLVPLPESLLAVVAVAEFDAGSVVASPEGVGVAVGCEV